MDKGELLAHLRELETALHSKEVRCSAEQLGALLHDSFQEVGYSGRRFDKQTILEAISDDQESTVIWSQDFELSMLQDDIALLSYRSAWIEGSQQLSRHARRASVWVRGKAGNWCLRYHQGTPTHAFEKAST
ncbi:DUF4440 domain-containing protein [Chromohalobacter canadensis]|uniref:nuclear transport factor 2 family protein n=1 Tax=Chromohalobacter canadensis TaxID=141389 RepID=UPI000BE30487|nr:nuclear transport factor 2 family protein [Chromohalobacter canadensis]